MRKVGWSWRSWHAIGVFIAASMSTAATAGADPPAAKTGGAETTESVERQATRYYDAGARAARAGEWEKARQAFQEALRIKAHPLIAGPLGQSEFNTGHYASAAEHMSWFLREAVKTTPAERQAVEKLLAEAKAKIGTVTVQVDVDGADVLADGRPVGKSPLAAPVFVEPGLRQFTASKESYGSDSRGIAVTAGTTPEVKLTLALPSELLPTKAAAQAPAPGQTSGAAPAAASPAARPPVRTPPAPTEGHPKKVLLYTGIGVSGALAIVGIGTAIGAGVKDAASQKELDEAGGRDKCNTSPACTDRYNDLQKQWAPLASASVYTFIGAAVVGGATLAYALLGKKLSRPAQVSAVVTPKGGAFVLTTSW